MKNILSLILISALFITTSCSRKPVTPETALQTYLDNRDRSFRWEIRESIKAEGVTLYRIVFTSQTWRDIEWKHEMVVMVPDEVGTSDAFLFITGGSIKDGVPSTHDWSDELITAFGRISVVNRMIGAIIWQVPNQPLYGDLTEDALITYTLDNFRKDGDYSWPLLFPMTKSAVKAMDVMQEFAKGEAAKDIDSFIISGASKRGWTTWLTGAMDKRVKAICPMVIDVLNMPVNINYQKVVWGDYSVEIIDYVKLGIAQQMGTPEGTDLVSMIDPFSYRSSLTMPKMIFMGTNDPYWPVDAVKHYIDSIPGDNHLCYTPNAGHNLGDKHKALTSISAFLNITQANGNYPDCKYEIAESDRTVSLRVTSEPGMIVDADLWMADSFDSDFRDEVWSEADPEIITGDETVAKIDLPESGYIAFYVDLKHRSPGGIEYTQSTRMFVADSVRLWLK